MSLVLRSKKGNLNVLPRFLITTRISETHHQRNSTFAAWVLLQNGGHISGASSILQVNDVIGINKHNICLRLKCTSKLTGLRQTAPIITAVVSLTFTKLCPIKPDSGIFFYISFRKEKHYLTDMSHLTYLKRYDRSTRFGIVVQNGSTSVTSC